MVYFRGKRCRYVGTLIKRNKYHPGLLILEDPEGYVIYVLAHRVFII